MVNYFRLIEPYLFGSLSPEEQQAFERQLVRNPALANEFTLRFSLVRVLLANPEYHPFRSSLKLRNKRPSSSSQSVLPSWVKHTWIVAVLLGLAFGMYL